MISKRSRIEKIKYNNRYKIIYSTPYRQIYKYLNRLSPSYAKNFMINIKYIEIDYDKESCEMLNSQGIYTSLYNAILYKDSYEGILTHELTHMASTNISSTTNYSTGIIAIPNHHCKKRNKGTILDEGITQDITNHARKIVDCSVYPFPTFIASLLYFSYGIRIYKPYFQCDYSKFVNQFDDRLTIKKLINNMEKMNEYENRNKHKRDNQTMLYYMKKTLENAIDLVYYNEIKKKNYNLNTLIYEIYYIVENKKLDMFYDTKFIYEVILERLNKLEKQNKQKSQATKIIGKRRVLCKK